MRDQLAQKLRSLIIQFDADVRRAVLRSLQAALDAAPELGADLMAHAAAPLAPAGTDAAARSANGTTPDAKAAQRPRRRASYPTHTAEEMALMREQVTAIIRQQPGQSTAELARIVGIPRNRLRPQLRQLADEGVIMVEEHDLGGVKRHTYRAADLHPGHHAEPVGCDR